MAKLQDLITRLKQLVGVEPRPLISPLASPSFPVKPVEAKGTGEAERKIRAGLRAYAERYAGGIKLPIEDYVPLFVEATERYPIFKQYPFLLPQISILESSGGLNVTRENNPLNWAARVQKQGLYSPQSWEQSIRDAITAIAGDVEARPLGTNRYRQTLYYEPFRRGGDLRTFADIYEPASPSYYQNLIEGIRLFEQQ